MTQKTFACIALLALLTAPTLAPCAGTGTGKSVLSAADLPTGVRYAKATPLQLEQAAATLRGAMAKGPEALAAMLGGHTNPERVLTGPFLAIEFLGDDLHARRYVRNFTYTATWDREGTKFQAPGFYGETLAEKRLLAQYLFLITDRDQPGVVRAANFDELSIIWWWISWDIDEPLLVYEVGNERLAFDFDPATGRITWIERLTDPCFTGKQDEKQVLACNCLRVDRDRQKWQVRLESLPVCRATTNPQYSTSILNEEPAARRKQAVLHLSDRTARVDRNLAKFLAKDYALLLVEDGTPTFTSVGKLLSGSAPAKPVDDSGKAIHGYVLMAHVIDSSGVFVDNRPMLYTDERLLDVVVAAAKTWRVEPAKLDGVATSEVVWQQFDF